MLPIEWLDLPVLAKLSESRTLFELGLVIVLAAAAPLVARVLGLPSILLLLLFGFGAGAIGALDPNALLGENLISAVVSVAVGIILFDSGLDLNFREVARGAERVVRRLLTVGIAVTWAVGAIAAYLLFDLSWEVAIVLGAVLVVSGPTVVGPLLDFIRPSKAVNNLLKWEGTLADPLGATLGVLTYQAVIAGQASAGEEIAEFFLAVGIGAGFGLAGAVLAIAWARWFRPSQSQAVSGVLLIVVAMVVGADLLRDDTGLITGLVMGAIIANRLPAGIAPTGVRIELKKLASAWRGQIALLATFLIGVLFIILSARVSPDDIGELGWVSLAFIAVLVLLGRPLAVALSTLRSSLQLRERAFLAWMAPRGIVAAATSSTFALGLNQAGVGGGAEKLIPITFVVIVATALIYGLTGSPVARALRVSSTGPGGVLLVGANPPARSIAGALSDRGLTVVLWTSDDEGARAAQAEGLAIYRGALLEDADADAPTELDEVETALLVSDDDALNAIAADDLSDHFGAGNVYQVAPGGGEEQAGFYTRTRVLFDDAATYDELASRLEAGASVAVHGPATEGGEDVLGRLGASGIPMFIYTPDQDLHVLTAGERPTLEPGQELIGLTS
jgi:NhaP-type Na+/H+ or K+/H+ antiporter